MERSIHRLHMASHHGLQAAMSHLPVSQQAFVCAYLINQYPKVSHSFVRREILALEAQGLVVHRFAVRGWDEHPVDPQDRTEQAQTRYLLKKGLLGLVGPTLMLAVSRPSRWLTALLAACRMSAGADRPWPYHMVYFMEACLLARWLMETKVKHIHAHFGTNSAETAILAALMADCGCSFTVHGPEEFDKPQALHLAQKVALSKFVVAISSYGKSQLFRWLAQTEWPKVKVVHCGIDQSFFGVERVPVPAGPRLVCVGRLCEQKGQLLLIEAAAELQRRGIEFKLVLAGDGELRQPIEAAIHRHGLQTKIEITGWISGAQVREHLLASRAMVLPSFAEGLPVVIMEAMALGRPVLSTYVAGIPELVVHQETGWLFPAGDVAAMTEAMAMCLSATADELSEMGQAGRQRVNARHGIDESARRMIRNFAAD
jgi:colanic acid/amylovoran biosynthesis glycosyltransferase